MFLIADSAPASSPPGPKENVISNGKQLDFDCTGGMWSFFWLINCRICIMDRGQLDCE